MLIVSKHIAIFSDESLESQADLKQELEDSVNALKDVKKEVTNSFCVINLSFCVYHCFVVYMWEEAGKL